MSDGDKMGRTIQLFLVDGTPNGLVVATLHGWTGSVLVSRQPTFAKLLSRPETDRTGIYLLYGADPDNPLRMRVYVGEADIVRRRIERSAKEREFWEIAVAITTSDDALTKGHVRYLEARMMEMVEEARRVTLDNAQQPPAEAMRLPEADRANMEAFLANIKVVLPVVGLDLLKPLPKSAPPVSQAPIRAEFEIRHKSGIMARAIEENGEFVVLEGTETLRNTAFVNSSYGALKEELVENGVLKADTREDRYTFTQSFPFRSPSAAAAVILDRNSNGRTEWKVVGEASTTYHDWQNRTAQEETTP